MPSLYNIPLHEEYPYKVNAIVEIPKGTSTKYEYDKDLELFRLDRCLTSAMIYPSNYGFIPSTLGEDGDALDVLVYNTIPIQRETLVECNVIGMLDMEDDGEKDYKILGCPTSHIKEYTTLDDIDSLFLKVTKNFFEHYKELNDKEVVIHDWMRRQDAYTVLRAGSDRYLNK